jgi:hypothetical protein
VRLGRAWGGSKSIFDQFVTPFLRREGLRAGSQGLSAYAMDYPTWSGADEARALAYAMGNRSWRPDSTDPFFVTVDGERFRVQILWGTEIQHHDHIHVGIRRA